MHITKHVHLFNYKFSDLREQFSIQPDRNLYSIAIMYIHDEHWKNKLDSVS